MRRATSTIALVYRGRSSFDSRFDGALLHGVSEELAESNYDLLLINVDRAQLPDETLGQMLVRKGVSGALLRTTDLTREMCFELGEQGFPAVAMADRIDHDRVGSAYCISERAIEEGLGHLHLRGHRRFAVATNVVDDHDHSSRVEVFRRFLRDRGLPFHDDWFVRCPADTMGGRIALEQLMRCPERPTAVFALDLPIAQGICLEGMRTGIHVPRDLSLLTFDDTVDRFSSHPRLSSVVQPTGLLGRRATRFLVDIIDRRAVPGCLEIETTFEALDSTSAPALEAEA